MPSLKTSRTQLICRACSATFWTQVRGRSTKCPHCGAGRYVRQDAEWEGPVTPETRSVHERAVQAAGRLPVWCTCSCGHRWQSRANDGQRLRCPSCRAGVRIPVRTHQNTQADPNPRPPRKDPDPRPSTRTTYREPTRDLEPVVQLVSVPSYTSSVERLLGKFLAKPSETAPASAPVQPTPRPAPPEPRESEPAVDPRAARNAERDEQRRNSACQVVRSLAGPYFVWIDQPAGACEVLDTNLVRGEQRCPAAATRAVVFRIQPATETLAYACTRHAPALKSMADNAPAISATISPLR